MSQDRGGGLAGNKGDRIWLGILDFLGGLGGMIDGALTGGALNGASNGDGCPWWSDSDICYGYRQSGAQMSESFRITRNL
ncbi:hypothetical protein AQZ50_05360 [Novosphingobium sp. Fuku2-ISO-50]|nr:hypothetical protein AQZ50_05360 [Novosphingobium sp. Fuku2-ISO-50]